jgi:hypothetical protein
VTKLRREKPPMAQDVQPIVDPFVCRYTYKHATLVLCQNNCDASVTLCFRAILSASQSMCGSSHSTCPRTRAFASLFANAA